ncbi:MAG: hypothetical protein HC927_11925, partial [Deltaproteobacteria bacterium]|nr:hypothetical protein [Deltaproteobacteria bacterium]
KEILGRIDPVVEARKLRTEIATATSEAKRKKAAKRLRVIEAFRNSGNKPDWMMLDVIPVLPPDLRPLVLSTISMSVPSQVSTVIFCAPVRE